MTETGPTALVADDEAGMRESVARALRREGFQVTAVEDGAAALDALRRAPVDLLVADLRMPGLDGLELLRAAKLVAPDTEVVVLSGHATVEEAVEAMKEGAYDFLTKPFDRAPLVRVARQAVERRRLVLENRRLRRRLDDLAGAEELVGRSPQIQEVLRLVKQVAPTTTTVLIQGESGTGKELVARAIHQLSPRRERPFVRVNCAALPDTLLESELFGHEKGAFTGAVARRQGRFEVADGGTLLLDEIGDLSAVAQAKVLRVLQEGEFEPVGASRTVRVDVRVLAATNQDLTRLVGEKRFREDLYYRLHVISVTVPPLRERREDVTLLAQHFLQRFAARNHRTLEGFTEAALARLADYAWPGNVRELEHAVERAVVLAQGPFVDVGDLPEAVGQAEPSSRVVPIPIGMPLEEVEQRLIEETLRQTKGDKELAAKLLGIASRTIYRKLKERGEARDADGE
ncbi:MAG: Fis family transcriptional regulator [Candidatus Rokubacteria bacterium RBG_16_73_20]|nr:MAG: Fis family transcriptional regulator [Candidatus Rokubacteria bacterium GWA2_73_35]OGK97519.1 MAG: Fis family transcriptional regulator [Candidatus Rokubacteria bacterium RBG_16_73_20]